MNTKGRKLWKGISRLLFELTVVFIGVFLAFLASDWNNRQIEERRAKKTMEVLHQELSDYIAYSPVTIQAMQDSLDQYLSERKEGEMPAPAFYREPRASQAPTAAWEATVISGAYELLETQLFYEMTLHYNRVISFNDRFVRYLTRVEDVLVPELEGGNEAFYQNGRLRGEYLVLIQMLEEILAEKKQLRMDAEILRDRLELELDVG